MKRIIILIGMLATLMLYQLPACAQDGWDDDAEDIPLDGGLSLLLAGGIGYGIKKACDKRNKKKNTAGEQ